jgi:hypothetical protein
MIEASPRGPNQPTNATVRPERPDRASASATGSIRITVRLRTAYPSTRQSASRTTAGTTTAPNSSHVTSEASPAVCST